MLGAEDGRFAGNGSVARPVNALLAILSDTQLSDDLKAFYNPDQVLLAWRFRPFTYPRERRSVLIVTDREQRLQSRNRLGFQALDEVLVRPLSRAGARSQANLFQGDRCGKHNASLA